MALRMGQNMTDLILMAQGTSSPMYGWTAHLLEAPHIYRVML